jgi:hypothetical protein
MKFTKAHFDIDGQNLKFSVPIAKVDQENRTVSGFATLDNVDRQGDIVSTEASLEAFQEFRGNLREMHQSKAVGKVLSFSVEEFYDPSTEKMYTGVWVTAYISKGAQDTWEKVLDGTLSGFSIGGEIIEASNVFDKSMDVMVRHITKYALVELSVVDSPANQLANILSVVKSDTGEFVVKGTAVDIKTENIFWCPEHQVAVIKEADAASCIECTRDMENIGWVETNDVDKAHAIRTLIKNYTGSTTGENLGEGGKNMPEETVETVVSDDAVVEKSESVEETVVAEEATEAVEKAVEVEEVATEDVDFVKMFSELRDQVTKSVDERATEQATAIAELAKAVASNSETFSTTLDELSQKHAELASVVSGLSEALGNVAKAVEVIDEADAIKKSGDLGRSTEVTTKSIWGDVFRVR